MILHSNFSRVAVMFVSDKMFIRHLLAYSVAGTNWSSSIKCLLLLHNLNSTIQFEFYRTIINRSCHSS